MSGIPFEKQCLSDTFNFDSQKIRIINMDFIMSPVRTLLGIADNHLYYVFLSDGLPIKL